MSIQRWRALVAAIAFVCCGSALSRPIAYADATTLMGEWSRDAREASAFHAPAYWWSVGVVHAVMRDRERQHQLDYVRANYLVRRWNLNAAQGNAYVWGGVGRGRGVDFGDSTAFNAGFQLDYETLWFYSMLKSDWHRTDALKHRTDTAQLGVALYAHRWDELATWIVVQGKRTEGDLGMSPETALLFRFFKKTNWIEAGVTNRGGFTVMFMTNF